MKRVRSDEELQDLVEGSWKDFPLERLPKDLVFQLVAKSGLTIQEMQRLCSINRRFRSICQNPAIWDHIFIEKVIAVGPVADTDAARAPYVKTEVFTRWIQARRRMPDNVLRLLAFLYVGQGINGFNKTMQGVFDLTLNVVYDGEQLRTMLMRTTNDFVLETLGTEWYPRTVLRFLQQQEVGAVEIGGFDEDDENLFEVAPGFELPLENREWFYYVLLEDGWEPDLAAGQTKRDLIGVNWWSSRKIPALLEGSAEIANVNYKYAAPDPASIEGSMKAAFIEGTKRGHSHDDYDDIVMSLRKMPEQEFVRESLEAHLQSELSYCHECAVDIDKPTLVCGKCKSLAFCSSACMDNYFASPTAAAEHDAYCIKHDCKKPAYLAKHLGIMINDEEMGHSKEELLTVARLRDALLFDVEPTAAVVNEAHELIGALKKKRAPRKKKPNRGRSGSKSRRAASKENKKRAASKKRNMRKAGRAQSKSKSKEKRARSRSKSQEKKNARASQRSGSKSRRAASKENKKRAASKERNMKKAGRAQSKSKSKEKRAQSKSKSKEKKNARAASRSGSKSRRAASKENKKRAASKERNMRKAARSQSKSKSKEKKKPAAAPAAPARSKSKSKSKEKKPAAAPARSKSKDKSKSKEKGPRGRSRSRRGDRGESTGRTSPLLSTRSKRTDNRSYRGPTFNFGRGGGGGGGASLPSMPSVPTPQAPSFGGGGGGGSTPTTPTPAAPTVIVVPQQQPQNNGGEGRGGRRSDDDSPPPPPRDDDGEDSGSEEITKAT